MREAAAAVDLGVRSAKAAAPTREPDREQPKG